MAINQWIAAAEAVAQVDTFTPANVGIGNVFTLTVTGFDGTSHVISYTAAAATVADVTAGLTDAWNNSTNSLCTPITAADNTTDLTLTADTAGSAFQVASSATGGTATFTRVATTANDGPGVWSSGENWSLGNPPGENGAGEEVYVQDSSVDILYGLDNSAATNTIDALHVTASFTGKIGWNETAGYVGDYLQIKATNIFIGENFEGTSAASSSRIKIDAGTVATSVIVYNTSRTSDTNKAAFRFLCNNASSKITEIRKGTVSVAALEGETSTIGSVLTSYDTNKSSDSQLTLGRGVTITTYEQIGGKGTVKCATTNTTCSAGTLLLVEGAITNLTVKGGEVIPVTTDTITTCLVYGGTCDFTRSSEQRTVNTLKVGSGATLNIDLYDGSSGVVTVTNNIEAIESGRFSYRVSDV